MAVFELVIIPNMVIGDQTLLLYKEPRFTQDIDSTLGECFHDGKHGFQTIHVLAPTAQSAI
jgi:hypothetical protein